MQDKNLQRNMIVNRLHVGVIVIGRNEGDRLIACLESLLKCVDNIDIVYVDSGSSDNSLQEAKTRGVGCVSLDMSLPFTASRARNEGVKFLALKHPDLKYIQFVDGDCEIQPGWIDKAERFLKENPQYAVACGRRRERFPDDSIFNKLCDIEWNTPVGDANVCGGDALIRVKAFNEVDGFRDDLIAGEEPEMCFRIRERGWKIYRLDEEMTLHDAAITKISQWWSRAKRAGYAYANGYYLHGKTTEKFKLREIVSILTWALLIPLAIILLMLISPLFLGLTLIYFIQILRLMARYKNRLGSGLIAFYYASSNVIGKFPQAIGIIKFVVNTIKNANGTLIEYK